MHTKKSKVWRVIFLSVVYVTQMAALPKVVYLVSMPRSLSTAFLRMMHARQDFTIMSEPGVQTYLHLYANEKTDVTYWGDRVKEFSSVQERILNKAHQHQNTFVKELGFAACKYLVPGSDFLNQQDYYLIFLIRNPYKSLISYHKKLPGELQGKILQLMDYKELYELYRSFKENCSRKPLIVLAEDLMANPHKTVTQVCAYLNVPFRQECLSWQKLDDSFSLADEWNCGMPIEAAYYWFGHAMDSTGFEQETLTLHDHSDSTFAEIPDANLRALYKKTYSANEPYYTLFLEEYTQQQGLSN